MTHSKSDVLDRRSALKWSALGAAGLFSNAQLADLFALEAGETLVPFLDTPQSPPQRLDWANLESWLTPQDQVFNVSHYSVPDIAPEDFELEITGKVENPTTYSLEDLMSKPRVKRLMTLECAGNGASPGFSNAVYNSEWTGVALRDLLEAADLTSDAEEIVFLGADTKVETLREGTNRELEIKTPFGRSLSVEDAMSLPAIVAFERNGAPLTRPNGAPVRLIVPGYYGVANVKWLTRIEARSERYMGKYMAREYVTVRGEEKEGETLFHESSVSRMNLKSAVARVTKKSDGSYRAFGAVWGDGTPIERVDVRLDEGAWRAARFTDAPFSKYSWRFFELDLGKLNPGKHRVVSRGVYANGRMQPDAEADEIAMKQTYWEAYQQWPREFEI